MLKLRIIGKTNDIKWYRKMIDRDKRFEVIEHSEIFPIKGKGMSRAYTKIRRKHKNEKPKTIYD